MRFLSNSEISSDKKYLRVAYITCLCDRGWSGLGSAQLVSRFQILSACLLICRLHSNFLVDGTAAMRPKLSSISSHNHICTTHAIRDITPRRQAFNIQVRSPTQRLGTCSILIIQYEYIYRGMDGQEERRNSELVQNSTFGDQSPRLGLGGGLFGPCDWVGAPVGLLLSGPFGIQTSASSPP